MRRLPPAPPLYQGVSGILAKAVDKTVGVFAPRLVHSWQVARKKSAALLAYESARISRTNPSEKSTSADSDVLPDLKKLRDLSRALVRDDAHASAAADILEDNVVGEGILAQPACTPEETGLTQDQCDEWNKACLAEFTDWADNHADATEQGTFYELQALVMRTWIGDGDAIGHAVFGGDGFVACELIDADRVESPGFFDTDTIRGGVELGPHGEAIAYHVLDQHPDDLFAGAGARTTKRIAKAGDGYSYVQHVFRRRRPGQTRGVPWTASCLGYSRNLHHYLDSELIAARAASNYAVVIKKSVTPTDQDVFPVADNEQASGQTFLQELQPGTIEYLNEGEEMQSFSPNRPGAQFDAFVTRILRAMCSAMGLSYELVAKDFGRMNLSSARAMLRECRRGFDRARKLMVRQFCRPWYENVIRIAVQSGRLVPPPAWLDNPTPFLRANWVAPAYGIVDPVTDAEGATAAVEAGISTPQIQAAAQGLDSEQVLRERAKHLAAAMRIEKEFKLPAGALTRTSKQPQGTGAAPTDSNSDSASGGEGRGSGSTNDATADDTADAEEKTA